MASEWDLQNLGEIIHGLRKFSGHAGRRIDGFDGVHNGYEMGERNVEGRKLLWFCDAKELCVVNTWFEKNSTGGNIIDIDFVLIAKNNKKYLKDVIIISSE